MKTFILIYFLCVLPIYPQIGIGTTEPTASLDINGDLRIRTILEETVADLVNNSILVSSDEGVVNKIEFNKLYDSKIKTAIHGSFAGPGNITLILGSNFKTIPFDTVEFDTNNEFDTSSSIFTAKQDGIYHVSAQINSSAALNISTNYGIQILKGNTIIAQQNYANIGINLGITSINVTPPVRSVQTLVELKANETIKFRLYTNLASVSLLGSKSDSFFSIYQVK